MELEGISLSDGWLLTEGGRKSLRVGAGHTSWLGINYWVVVTSMMLITAWFGMSPQRAYSHVPPLSSGTSLAKGEEFTRAPSNQSWSAFRSDDAKNVCVTVVNHGASEVFVHLFRKRSLTGAFTVLPQRVSAMCSDVTVIEVECGSGTCLPQWYISDSN